MYESDEFESDSGDLSVSSVITPESNTQQVVCAHPFISLCSSLPTTVCQSVCLPQSAYHSLSVCLSACCLSVVLSAGLSTIVCLSNCQYCQPVFLLVCSLSESPKSLSPLFQTRIQELDSTITNEYIRQLKYAQLSSIDSSQARTPSPHLLSSLHSTSKEQSAGECQHVCYPNLPLQHLMYQPAMYQLYLYVH